MKRYEIEYWNEYGRQLDYRDTRKEALSLAKCLKGCSSVTGLSIVDLVAKQIIPD